MRVLCTLGILSVTVIGILGISKHDLFTHASQECAFFHDVMQDVAQDTYIQQYTNQECTIIDLLVETKQDQGNTVRCVVGFKPGNCELADEVQSKIIANANSIVEQNKQPVTQSDPQESGNAFAPLALPVPEVVEDVVPKTAPVPQVAKITKPVHKLVQEPKPLPISDSDAVIYEIVQQDIPVTQPTQNDVDTQVLGEDASVETSRASPKLLGALEAYTQSRATQQGSIQAKQLQEALRVQSLEELAGDTVLVKQPEGEGSSIVEGVLYLRSDDDVMLRQAVEDIKKKFEDIDITIRPLFPETSLLSDQIVEYSVDQTSYREIVDYLDSRNKYLAYDKNTLTNTTIEAHPRNYFQTANVNFDVQSIDDVITNTAPESQGLLHTFVDRMQNVRESNKGVAPSFGAQGFFSTQSVDSLDQRHLDYVGFQEALVCANQGRTVKVAIVDNGFDVEHEDLDDKQWKGYDEADQDNDVQVPFYEKAWNHGTKEAGIIGAEQNDIGVTGIYPNSDLVLIKSTKDTANGRDITNGIEAIAKAYELGAEVINLSRGGYADVPMLKRITKKIADEGVYLVAAAGNYSKSQPFYPAAYEWVIAVAAIDTEGERARFSNFGEWVDIAAPGVGILTTDLDNSYNAFDGTSEASPVVAGSLAMALSLGYTREDVVQHVFPTSEQGIGVGVIDMRFMCENLPEDQIVQEYEHQVAQAEATTKKYGLLLLVLGGMLVLLGLAGAMVSVLSKKTE